MPHLATWLGTIAPFVPPPLPPLLFSSVVMKTCLLAKQTSTFALLDCVDDLILSVFAYKQRMLTAHLVIQAASSICKQGVVAVRHAWRE